MSNNLGTTYDVRILYDCDTGIFSVKYFHICQK